MKNTNPTSNNNSNTKLNQLLGALTPNENAVIAGTLLGDGHLQRRVSGTCRLKIVHSTAQADYVWWKYNQLKRLCATTKPPAEVVNNKTFKAVAFSTSSLLLFGDFHELFYTPVLKGDRTTFVKTITPELIDKLPMNPLVLTTFFLDDGSVRDDCYAGKLATQGFSKEGCELLREYFLKWNINCNVVKHTKESQKHYLSIGASTFGNLVEVIEPTVRQIPSMVYKLNELRKPCND